MVEQGVEGGNCWVVKHNKQKAATAVVYIFNLARHDTPCPRHIPCPKKNKKNKKTRKRVNIVMAALALISFY